MAARSRRTSRHDVVVHRPSLSFHTRLCLAGLLLLSSSSLLTFCRNAPSSSSSNESGLASDQIGIEDHELDKLHPSQSVYTNQFVMTSDAKPEQLKQIAHEHGFDYVFHMFDGHHLLRHRRLVKRSLDEAELHHKVLSQHELVHDLKQQKLLRRIKRDFLDPLEAKTKKNVLPYLPPSRTRVNGHSDAQSDKLLPFPREVGSRRLSPDSDRVKFDDPQWPSMWYLNRGNDLDMNVEGAWAQNITGKNVVVTILDDGLEKDHPDLITNYDPRASYDVNGSDDDPMPRYDMIDSNRHGTRCAGEVAANANNSVCAVGVAYNARIGGIRMLDGDVTDGVEAASLSHNQDYIDIYSASWGPDDDGRTVDGPGEYAARAFENGIYKGRDGKGSIYVWASGNGGREKDNCNCDGYTNSIWTLSISSATEKGSVPWYSEACSSTLATTYSSGSYNDRQIVTTDLHHGCTPSHTGTSASAPLAAGICALTLEANSKLTWRDLQHIVVLTAKRKNLNDKDWITNGVGRDVSHWFGYGLLDAGEMVRISKDWKPVPAQKRCEFRLQVEKDGVIQPGKIEKFRGTSPVHCNEVSYIEHVQVKINLSAYKRGDIEIRVTSPAGTTSTLLAVRPMDSSRNGFNNWPFMTVHCWGEQPNGNWELTIINHGRIHNATLHKWSVIMYGTAKNPYSDELVRKFRIKQTHPVRTNHNRLPYPTKMNAEVLSGTNIPDDGPQDNRIDSDSSTSANGTKSQILVSGKAHPSRTNNNNSNNKQATNANNNNHGRQHEGGNFERFDGGSNSHIVGYNAHRHHHGHYHSPDVLQQSKVNKLYSNGVLTSHSNSHLIIGWRDSCWKHFTLPVLLLCLTVFVNL